MEIRIFTVWTVIYWGTIFGAAWILETYLPSMWWLQSLAAGLIAASWFYFICLKWLKKKR